MALNAENNDALWSSGSESSEEDESEDELRANLEFNFGEVNLESEDDEEAEQDDVHHGPELQGPQEAQIEEIEEPEVEVKLDEILARTWS